MPLTLGALLLAAGPAAAHAELVSTSPGSGASVSASPATVSLTFDEAVADEDVTMLVTGPDGASVTAGPAHVAGAVVSVPLKPLATTGAYHVAWRVVSDDGHPVDGQWQFTFAAAANAVGATAPMVPPGPGPAATSDAATAPVDDDPPSNWWATHLLHLVVGVGIVGVGGWLMLILTRPPRPRRETS